jgi:hypothetical protein
MQMQNGRYRVLKSPLPALEFWTCGDGCCCDWKDDEVEYAVGSEISVTDFENAYQMLGDATYSVGSDYEGFQEYQYRTDGRDYVKDGYLEFIAAE